MHNPLLNDCIHDLFLIDIGGSPESTIGAQLFVGGRATEDQSSSKDTRKESIAVAYFGVVLCVSREVVDGGNAEFLDEFDPTLPRISIKLLGGDILLSTRSDEYRDPLHSSPTRISFLNPRSQLVGSSELQHLRNRKGGAGR